MTAKEITQLIVPVISGLAGMLAAHLSAGAIQEIGIIGGIALPVLSAIFSAFQPKIGAAK